MKVRHSVPVTEVDDHCLDHQCPCDPVQHVTAAPGKRPVATITHQPLKTLQEQS